MPNLHTLTRGFQLSIRAAVAAGLSLALAQFLELQYPIYAVIAAIIVTELSPSESRKLGLQRMAGTVVGAACGAALCTLLEPGPWAIGFSIMTAMLLCHLVHLRAGAKLAGVVCGILMLTFSTGPWIYAFYRVIETMLGVAVAVLVSFVPKLIRTDSTGHS
jgi:uncharacterized membrane protein YgaE (UPF0421/DUF939 family)